MVLAEIAGQQRRAWQGSYDYNLNQTRHHCANQWGNRVDSNPGTDVVKKTLDYIIDSLAKGDKVELRNFGVFDVIIRKARIGRNPNEPETDVPIPARAMIKFKAGKEMRAEVLKLTPKKK